MNEHQETIFEDLSVLSFNIREKQVGILVTRKRIEAIKAEMAKEEHSHKLYVKDCVDDSGKKLYTNDFMRDAAVVKRLDDSKTYQEMKASVIELTDGVEKEEIELGLLRRRFRVYEIVSRLE